MINETYKSMLSGKSVIRELNEYANDITRHPHLKPEDMFDYSLGNPSVPVPEAFNARIKALLDSGDPMLVHGYSPSLGIPAAREKIAASLNRRFGMRYTMDDIFMTSGAAGALAHAFRLVTQPGDEILTFAPFFPEYRPYTAGAGLTLRVVPADTQTFQINFDAFERMLTPAVQAVLINTPNNPSGAVYSAETLRRMAALLLQKEKAFGHDIWLISDEPYREIVYQTAPLPWVPDFYDNTLVCYSYSKSLSLPGQRIGYVLVPPQAEEADLVYAAICGAGRALGYVCAPKPIIQCLTKLHQFGIMSAPTVSQYAAIEAMRNGDRDIEHMREEYDSRRRYLVENLRRIGLSCFEPKGAFYVFPDIRSTGLTSNEFCERFLREERVAVIPGSAFGPGGEGFVRACYAASMKDISEAITRMDNFLTNLRRSQGRG